MVQTPTGLISVLETNGADIFLRSNGTQATFSELEGKIIGLYFAASSSELSFLCHAMACYPHSNQTARDRFKSLYAIEEVPQLVLLNERGDFVSSDGFSLVFWFGTTGHPFAPERIKQLEEEEESQKKNQTLNSVLATPERDFLITSDGKEVPIPELEGKMVGLYVSLGSFRSCQNFTSKLIDLDKFGKTLNLNVCEYIGEFGIQAYPFSTEKIAELEELREARRESQTLVLLLVADELDFVIGKDAMKVPVSELVGKTVLFYFSRLACPPCRAFTPKLAKAYHEIKANHPDFEVIFVSLDNDEESFKQYYAEMPWLALPYDDKRENLINRTFKYDGIPHLAAIGPDGTMLCNEAKELVMFFGSDSYPFDEDRKKEMDSRLKEIQRKRICWRR
ncbi:hypothetical protein ACOSQ2_008859 [Xanthoceras sorbifolium]